MNLFSFVSLVLLIVLMGCDGHIEGAPDWICTTQRQRPQHGMFLPQNSISPYSIHVTSRIYQPNKPINVTIQGNNGQTFKGFFITSDTSTNVFRGPVANITSNVKTVPYCGMTHTDNSLKQSVTFTWTPPSGIHIGAVQFMAVVVYNHSLFWTNVLSNTMLPDLTIYKTYDQIFTEMQQNAKQKVKTAVSNTTGSFGQPNLNGLSGSLASLFTGSAVQQRQTNVGHPSPQNTQTSRNTQTNLFNSG